MTINQESSQKTYLILSPEDVAENLDYWRNRLTAQVIAEWRASGVHDDITILNVIYLSGTEPYEYLLYALPRSERRNDGRLRDRWLNRYEHCNSGGWWCSGIDVLTGEPANWGQFKPKKPYRYRLLKLNHEFKGFGKGREPKTIKYEPPRKVPTEIYALRVPLHIWKKIAEHNNVSLPDNIDIDPRTGEAKGFWSWVLNNPSIPVTITEGAKKAGALLTAGYVAIALPGIWNGIRRPKDEFGKKTGLTFLIPQLKVFAAKGREINFCFDNDAKPSAKKLVKKALLATGKLFEKEGCTVKVITWNELEKGVDDLIVAHGVEAFEQAYQARKPLSSYKLLDILDLSPYVSLTIDERHLPKDLIPPDNAKIIGLNSPKNTGKTVWLTIQVRKALANGQRVIVITHRIQLALALSHSFGVAHIEEIKNHAKNGDTGYALCIDSLHQDSQAAFDPEAWQGATIIIDEAEQVFWHALNSSTLKSNRIKILNNLEILIKVALSTGGKIYLADADLSPIAIQYIQRLLGCKVKIWVVHNLCIPNLGKRKLFTYHGKDPRLLVNALIRAIKNGEKVLIHTSGQKQKSKWGTTELESFIRKKLGELGKDIRILRIDAKSVKDPSHPAFRCTKNVDGVISNYDVVLASPTIETGISIDTKEHFNSVWAIAWGVQTVDAVCQSVERLRDDVPRHLWARTVGMKFVGNRSTEVKKLLAATHKETRYHVGTLMNAGYQDFGELDWDWQNAHLITWGRRAAIVNTGMYKYQESIVAKLSAEGYQVIPYHLQNQAEAKDAAQLKAQLDLNVEQRYQQYCQTVSDSETLSFEEYKIASSKHTLTQAEDYQLTKAKIYHRYGQIDVTPSLVAKDENGWHSKILLHYYLTIGHQFLAPRDAAKFDHLISDPHDPKDHKKAKKTKKRKAPFKPDLNQQQLSLKVNGFQVYEFEQFLVPGAIFSDRTLQPWQVKICQPLVQQHIKQIYGVNICANNAPIANANKLLNQLDLKLVECGWTGGRADKHRLYKLIPINHDSRAAVFEKWFERDLSLHIDSDLCLYLTSLLERRPTESTSKILLEIAAAGGQYQAPEINQNNHREEECVWLFDKICQFLSTNGAVASWLEFFAHTEERFFAATWDYLHKSKGLPFVKNLVDAIWQKGGEPALAATHVAF